MMFALVLTRNDRMFCLCRHYDQGGLIGRLVKRFGNKPGDCRRFSLA